jgi:hypothetical protein
MPFVHDETEIEWPEDGSDPAPPRADEFVYLPAPEYSGVSEPVRFSIRLPADPIEPAEQQTLLQRAPNIQGLLQRGILGGLLGRGLLPANQQQPQISFEERRERARLQQEQRIQHLFAATIPALRSVGVKRAYCRYDGGNDEGFAWLDHYELQGGQRIEESVVVQRLYETKFQDQLHAAGFVNHPNSITSGDELAWLRMFMGELSNEWASLLLGESFGTGEYSMYGALTVDLDECTITDDPNADPVVQNIEIVR